MGTGFILHAVQLLLLVDRLFAASHTRNQRSHEQTQAVQLKEIELFVGVQVL